jgi:hypothetical protein
MPKVKNADKIIAIAFTLLFTLSASSVNALTKWTSPSRPGGVLSEFDQAIINLTNWILGFVAMIAVLAIIWGGVNYLTSAGNEDQARSGKNIIKYALMGLVVAGIAYAVVNVIVTVILK